MGCIDCGAEIVPGKNVGDKVDGPPPRICDSCIMDRFDPANFKPLRGRFRPSAAEQLFTYQGPTGEDDQ